LQLLPSQQRRRRRRRRRECDSSSKDGFLQEPMQKRKEKETR
jgi:hypothetical protein